MLPRTHVGVILNGTGRSDEVVGYQLYSFKCADEGHVLQRPTGAQWTKALGCFPGSAHGLSAHVAHFWRRLSGEDHTISSCGPHPSSLSAI